MTVFVYFNTSKQVGEPEHVKVLRHQERRGNLVRGVAFEHEVLE